MRPRVDGQHVLHGGYERAIGLRRNDPACRRWGWNVFLSVLLMLRAGTIDNLELHDLFFQQPQRPACAPLGRLGTSQRISSASFSPSKSAQPPVSPVACGSTPPRSLLPPVACAPGKPETLVSKALIIRLSLQPAPASETSAFNNIRAFSSRWAGLLPSVSTLQAARVLVASRTTYHRNPCSHVAGKKREKEGLGRPDQKGSTGRDNRMFGEGVLWIVRTGSPWRDPPEVRGLEQRVPALQSMEHQGCLVADLRGDVR